MPYIITRIWYPPGKADEVGKKYLEVLKKYPPDESLEKVIVPAAVSATKDGLEALIIAEVERAKLGDASKRTGDMMFEFRNIEGFNYEIKTWLTAEEALERLGLG
jgi:hypothetical protein